jgi:hypothetical protein
MAEAVGREVVAMPEQKKRGFGALEQRIHEMEEEDRKRDREASGDRESAPRTTPDEARNEKGKTGR